jgi:hypothetical protein
MPLPATLMPRRPGEPCSKRLAGILEGVYDIVAIGGGPVFAKPPERSEFLSKASTNLSVKSESVGPKPEDRSMNTRIRSIQLGGTLTALALAVLLIFGNRPIARAADDNEVEYTFGRPIQKDEQTYDWYRKTHADEAAKRYGVDPEAVGDGM